MAAAFALDAIPRLLHELPDGRRLSYCRLGDPQGQPVYYFHGSPSCRVEAAPAADAAKRRGFALYALDRPGHGASSPFPPRYTMPDWAEDVAAFADAKQHDTFGVIGVSGGGPYVLACAASPRLAPRLAFAYDLAGWAPVGDSQRLSAAMAPLDCLAMAAAPRLGPIFDVAYGVFGLVARHLPAAVLGWSISSSMSATDRAAYQGASGALMKAIVSEAFAQGPAGPSADARLQYGRWGFSLDDVDYPVRFFHGDNDRFVPLEFAKYKHERIPHSSLRVFEGAGHFFMLQAVDEVLKEVSETQDAPQTA